MHYNAILKRRMILLNVASYANVLVYDFSLNLKKKKLHMPYFQYVLFLFSCSVAFYHR